MMRINGVAGWCAPLSAARCLAMWTFIKIQKVRKGKTEDNWANLRDEINVASKETIGALKMDWFDDNAGEIETLLADKHAAHRDRLADKTSDSKKERFKYLRGKY